MEPIWLKSYPDSVPAEINPEQYRSIVDLFEQSASKFAERPAYSNFGHELSFADLERLSRDFAAWLIHGAGLQKGDRIALMMPNILQYPVCLFAALRAGLIVVNVNPLYTPRELELQLIDSGASAIVVLENFAHTLESVRDHTPIRHVITTQLGDLFGFPQSFIVNGVVKYVKQMVPAFTIPDAMHLNHALDAGSSMPLERIELEPEDIAFLQYTGGTTGISKGAMLSHRNMIANLMQAHAWSKSKLIEAQEISVTALPLYHIFALTANALISMHIGAKCLLITNPRDFPDFVKTLKKERFTVFIGINTLFNALLHTDGFDEIDFSTLKFTLGGGMSVQRSVAEAWKKVTGDTLVEAYGLTETAPAVCINPMDIPDYTGAIGLPLPSTEISIRSEDGNELPIGEAGELWVKGPQVMRGYWNHPKETTRTLTAQGWLHTGDVARVDENGYVYIVDRLKDMILISGFNVYPNEIETVLAAHDKVLEAGVIGVFDPNAGEAVKAIVVKADDSLSEDELRNWCRDQLTGYKRPKYFLFVDALPKSNVGTVLRRELREQHADSSYY